MPFFIPEWRYFKDWSTKKVIAMPENQPDIFDAVLGGQHPNSLATAAILGGLEGVKKRLANMTFRVQILGVYHSILHPKPGEGRSLIG